jgi:hypothetical protein
VSKDTYLYGIGSDDCSRPASSDDAEAAMREETGGMYEKEERLFVSVILA